MHTGDPFATALGMNNVQRPVSPNMSWLTNAHHFVIGLGTNISSKGNTLTIFRNGNWQLGGAQIASKIVDNGNTLNVMGRVSIQGIPSYTNDAAADADATLPSKSLYKLNGSRAVYQKP